MSIQGSDFLNNRKVDLKTSNHIIGLDTFRRRLERDFYSEVNISNYGLNEEDANLSIEVKCNFSLSEALYFLQNPIPRSIISPNLDSGITILFLNAYTDLREENYIKLDISELTISLTDSTILISKIYEQSIYDQIENIAAELCKHEVYYTKGLSETPFEIFIPVFEEDDHKPDLLPTDDPLNKNDINDYFIFWGVYYDRTDESVIYDVQSQRIIHGDIQILNE